MRQGCDLPRNRLVWRLVALVLIVCVALSLTACKKSNNNEPITENAGSPVGTGTVQAMPSDASTSSTSSLLATSAASLGTSETSSAQPGGNASTVWPAKVGKFATKFSGPVWYPKYVPAGYKIDSLDVVEFDPGSGLVCDIVYLKGEKVIQFTQGSPKKRDYEIVSSGRVPWGTEISWIVHQDPADTSTPAILVYSNGGNFAELSGDVSNAEIKAMAASMVPVQ